MQTVLMKLPGPALQYMERILTLDNKHVVGILSTDLSKAFDSLHPPLLLAWRGAYGFSESAIDMMRCYFTERKKTGCG